MDLNRPMISVDRTSRSVAVLLDWRCIREFIRYEDEQTGVDEARKWLRERTPLEPEMIYPRITRMRMS